MQHELTRTEAIDLAHNAALRLAVMLDHYGDILGGVQAEVVFENDFTGEFGNHVVMYAHYRPDIGEFVGSSANDDPPLDDRDDLRVMPLFEQVFEFDDIGEHIELLMHRCKRVRNILARF